MHPEKSINVLSAIQGSLRFIKQFPRETIGLVFMIACFHFLLESPLNPFYTAFNLVLSGDKFPSSEELLPLLSNGPLMLFVILTIFLIIIGSLLRNIYLIRIFFNFYLNIETPFLARDFFRSFRFLGIMLLAAMVYFGIVLGGFFLFILPSFVWTITYMFYDFSLIHQKKSLKKALSESRSLTTGVRWNLFWITLWVNVLFYIIANVFTSLLGSYIFIGRAVNEILFSLFTLFLVFFHGHIYLELYQLKNQNLLLSSEGPEKL